MTTAQPDSTALEAVYYAAPAPTSQRTLTLLGLVFDRMIFPGVHVPDHGVDLDATLAEYDRIRALPPSGPDSVHMLNLMSAALNAEHLKDFCIFTAHARSFTDDEPGAHRLARELELAIFGPPPENFFPTVSLRFSKGLPGDDRPSIHSPSWLLYPANALLYAGRTGAVLVNDDPSLPIPAVPNIAGRDIKTNAKQLAMIMALESVKFVLPDLPDLSIPEISAFRAETAALVKPFRRAMLHLSKELSAAIISDASLEDVRRHAQLIVETTVGPELEELKTELAQPTKPWYRRPPVRLVTAIPTMVGAFAGLPTYLATAMTLAQAVGLLADVRDAQLEKQGIAKRGSYHYLLKIEGLKK